jgi:fructose-1,6-bisphosphatase/inositol monophosphatase family enzyme
MCCFLLQVVIWVDPLDGTSEYTQGMAYDMNQYAASIPGAIAYTDIVMLQDCWTM